MSLYGGKAYEGYQKMAGGSNCRVTLMGDSLTNANVQTNRFAHAMLKNFPFGASITAMLEPRTGNTGSGSASFLDYNSYEGADTSSAGNNTNVLGGGNTYGNWGDFAAPTPDEYFGIPVEGFNWYWDGTLGTTATYVARTLTRTANPISGSSNTFTLYGLQSSAIVFRWLYYGATGLRSTHTATGAFERRDVTTLEDRVDFTVDARPYWSEGDNPDTDVSARTGGVKLGEANALWPDLVTSGTIGGAAVGSYYSDKEGATPSSGHYNIIGTMAFQCAGAADDTWVGGIHFETVGASSWTLAGFSENTASSAGTQKTFDDDNWLYFRDVTTISRSTPGVIILWVDPEAITAANAKAYTQNFIDKVTAADASIGNPTPTVIVVINYKTDARSAAEMEAWRNGIIAGCDSRVNAGYLNLYDYYGGSKPSGVTDGTHPDDETAANNIFSSLLTIMQAATAPTKPSFRPGLGLGMGF